MLQRAGINLTPHNLLTADVVFTALRIISTNITKMGNPRAYKEQLSPDNIPFRQWTKSQPELLTATWGGPKVMFQVSGWQKTVWSLALMGESYWFILLRDDVEMPLALDVLNPLFMLVKTNKATGEPIYEYGTGNDRVILDPEDVVHIPFMSLPASRRALNPVEYVGIAGALALAAYEFGSSWFSQGASPDFILTTDAKLGQEEVQRIAQKFLIEHAGNQQAHLPLVLDRGLKAEKVMTSPDEAQYLQTLEFARSVIGSWFGIPSDLIANGLQRQTPAAPGALEDQQRAFLTNCLASYIVPLEEALSSLLPKGIYAAWDEGKLSRPNATAQAERITALRQGQIATPNELRVRELGWAPIPGGDDIITPLASNTAPSQTDAQDAAKTPKGASGGQG